MAGGCGLHCLLWGGGKHLSTGPQLTVNSDKPPASCPVSQQFYLTEFGKYGDEINDILFKRYNLILNNFQRPRAVTIMICLSEVSPLLGPVTPQPSPVRVCGMWGSTMVATHPAMFYSDLTLAGTDNNTIITGTASSLLSPSLLSPGYDQSNPTDSSQCPHLARPDNKVNSKIMGIFHF